MKHAITSHRSQIFKLGVNSSVPYTSLMLSLQKVWHILWFEIHELNRGILTNSEQVFTANECYFGDWWVENHSKLWFAHFQNLVLGVSAQANWLNVNFLVLGAERNFINSVCCDCAGTRVIVNHLQLQQLLLFAYLWQAEYFHHTVIWDCEKLATTIM